MAHDKHEVDGINKDLEGKTREDYLKLAEGWTDPFGQPTVERFDRFQVVRDDLIEVGSKGRFADLFLKHQTADHFVYVAPRVGYAAISLARICRKYGKKLTLFAPASKTISEHQALALELGAKMRFVRVAAMPILNGYAEKFAAKIGGKFIPLGLRDALVTAAIIDTCRRITEVNGEPSEVWSAISTGVLSRGLQIGWPNAKFHAVAVARNLHAGELGRAQVWSYPRPFQDDSEGPVPPFPSIRTYDAKAWHFMQLHGANDALFWNVAGELKGKWTEVLQANTKSAREWSDMSDLDPSKPAIQRLD
jgi:hypothetical protein